MGLKAAVATGHLPDMHETLGLISNIGKKKERQEQRVPGSDSEEAEHLLLEYLRQQQIFLWSCSIWSQSVANLGFDK